MRQPSSTILVGVLSVVAAGSLFAQQPVTLSKPLVETAESFTAIASIRELPSGKVLVSDTRDKVVQLVDLQANSMTKVGREGSGPGEYAWAGTLIGLPDGSTLLHDILNRRFLVIGADGKPGAFVDMPRPPTPTDGARGPGGGVQFAGLGSIGNVRGYDARGRIYFAAAPFSPTGGTADSIALLRWDRVKTTFDTVGFVKPAPGSASRSGSGGNVQVRIGNNVRFTPAETWGVAGDGSIARVFPQPYRVAWYSGSLNPVAGPIVPYTPIKVTEADKKEVIDALRRSPPQGFAIRVGGGSGPATTQQNIQAPDPEFADTKPAFESGGGAGPGGSVQVSPDGEVWVLRTRPAGDKIPTYDVFDRTGKLVKKVSLNPNSRLAGFGKGVVYVVRNDDDDLQYLQRYTKP